MQARKVDGFPGLLSSACDHVTEAYMLNHEINQAFRTRLTGAGDPDSALQMPLLRESLLISGSKPKCICQAPG